MYKHIKAYREQKVEWDEVREQRVFKAIAERRVAQSGKWTRSRIIGGGTIAAAALVAVVIGIFYKKTVPEEAIEQSDQIAVAKHSAPKPVTPKNASVLTLASAGQVILLDGADVFIVEQRADTVHLEQQEGQALYDIIHQKGGLVQVSVAGIVITVAGTMFQVTVDEPVVRIEVKQGVVRVDDGKQTVTLEAPETISVAIPQKAPRWLPHAKKKRTGRKTATQEVVKKEDLFYEVDQARRQGDLTKAAKLLRRIIAQKESLFSVASAEFTLGKVERTRGRHAAAARAFHRCAKQAPNRSLGEDALAEAALSWQAAGNTEKAKTLTRTYLDHYPKGLYRSKLKRLVN